MKAKRREAEKKAEAKRYPLEGKGRRKEVMRMPMNIREIQEAQAKALHRGDTAEALRLAEVLWKKIGHNEAGFEFPKAS